MQTNIDSVCNSLCRTATFLFLISSIISVQLTINYNTLKKTTTTKLTSYINLQNNSNKQLYNIYFKYFHINLFFNFLFAQIQLKKNYTQEK